MEFSPNNEISWLIGIGVLGGKEQISDFARCRTFLTPLETDFFKCLVCLEIPALKRGEQALQNSVSFSVAPH